MSLRITDPEQVRGVVLEALRSRKPSAVIGLATTVQELGLSTGAWKRALGEIEERCGLMADELQIHVVRQQTVQEIAGEVLLLQASQRAARSPAPRRLLVLAITQLRV